MTTPNVKAIVDFIARTRDSNLPADIADIARRSLIDWFAVSFAAMDEPEAIALARYVDSWRSGGDALTLFGRPGAAAPVALVNGTLAHFLDFDDMHFGAAYHAGAPTWAAVLALGMARHCSEREMLKAYAVGYEVGVCFGLDGAGLALVERGWHPTGVLAHISAAVASAYLLNLDADAIANALGTAATQAGGLIAAGGSASKPMQIGKAAMAGVLAAETAALGIGGFGHLLDAGPRPGLFQAMMQRDVKLDGLGHRWNMPDNVFKPYAACGFTHTAIDTARLMASRFAIGDVKAVRIFGNPVALKVAGNMQPTTATEARFSLSYSAALGFAGYAAAPGDFGEAGLRDPRIQTLMERTELVTEPAMERWSSKIEVELRNGAVERDGVLVPKGMAERPMTTADLEEKFDGVARPRLGPDAAPLLQSLKDFGRDTEPTAMQDILRAQRDANPAPHVVAAQ